MPGPVMEDYEGQAEQVSPPEQYTAVSDRAAAPRRVKTGGGQGRKSHACKLRYPSGSVNF